MTSRRRGYALIEILLVMSALTVVLGLCVGLIHVLHRLQGAGRDRLVEATARERLARQFRQDVHVASRSNLAETGGSPAVRLELHGPGQRVVEYVASDGRLMRNERDGSRQPRHEEYRFPSRAAPRFRTREEAGARFVVLRLRRDAGAGSRVLQRDADYEAELGRDGRLARRQGGGS